jgi:hypothetical protein
MDRPRAFNGILNNCVGVDLVVVDISKSLLVLNVSILSFVVLEWNNLKPSFLNNVFDFASSHLHDHGAMILIHGDGVKIKTEIKGFLKVYHLKVFKEWMGINHLRMMSARKPPQMVSATHISFFS